MMCGMIQSRSHERGALQSTMYERLTNKISATAATAIIAAVAVVMLCGSMFWGPSVCAAQARVDMIDVSELRPGMKGNGLTVFGGVEP